jgi:hypothetical protein
MEESKNISNLDYQKDPVSLMGDRVTLRDHFAGLAMQTLLNDSDTERILNEGNNYFLKMQVKASYKVADEMLKERVLRNQK